MRISDWSSDVCSSDLAGAHHQSYAAAHDGAAAPAKQRLGICMYLIVQLVFNLEEFPGMGVAPCIAAGVLLHGLVQAVQIAAGAKGLFTGAFQDYECNIGCIGPPVQLLG